MFEKAVIFITKCLKPIQDFLTGLWSLILKIDEWFSKKKPVTKNSIRWGFICFIIICLYVKERLDCGIERDNDRIRNTTELNALKKSVDKWQERYLHRLEVEIEELKEVKMAQDSSKKKIKEITKEI